MKTYSPLIKICANTSEIDLQLAADAGADYMGMIVEFPPSPRHVSLKHAIAMHSVLPLVAVTVNLSLERLLQIHQQLQPYALQLHGDESAEIIEGLAQENIRVWKAISGDHAWEMACTALSAGAEAILVDARAQHTGQIIYGGTGLRSDWMLARELVDAGHKVILAGGLNPQNVREAVRQVQPWMVDVVSGVERSPGIKDPQKVRDFIDVLQD